MAIIDELSLIYYMKIQKIIFLFILLFAIAILNGYLFNYINNIYFNYKSNGNDLNDFKPILKLTIIVILAPIIETLVFQYLPNKLLNKLGVKNEFLLVFIPAMIFGLVHFYFWLYAISAFVGGILLNFLYLYIKNKNQIYVSLLIVFLFHSFYNLYGYLFVM